MDDDVIYLDSAAATPVDSAVLEEMKPYFTDKFFNPSSVYLASREVKQDIDAARETVAHWLGARPSEIIFTAGATEANNLVINGIDGRVACSAIEHDAVLAPLKGRDHKVVKVDKHGIIKLDALTEAIATPTALVSVMYANNEIGTVQHVSKIADLVKKERTKRREAGDNTPLLLHTDASQAPNYLDLHVDKLGVDLMTLNGGKIYGPKQSGALYVRAGVELKPIVSGGGQERGMRSGTENVPAIVGFTCALRLAQELRKDETYRLEGLRRKLCAGLITKFSDAEIVGHKKFHLPNIVSVVIPRIDGERVVMMLDEAGIQVATGSACSALSDESSHVIKALGYSETEARSTLRISMGRSTKEAQIEKLLNVLPDIVGRARELSSTS